MSNYEGKFPFLHTPSPFHSLAFFQHDHGMPLELIQYNGSFHPSTSFFQVLFDAPRPEAIPSLRNDYIPWKAFWDVVLGSRSEAGRSRAFDTVLWFNERSEKRNGLQAVLVPVINVYSALKFWQEGLGFKLVERGETSPGEEWAYITFRSPVKSWSLSVILAETVSEIPQQMLDNSGFNCLALLSTSLRQDRKKIYSAGATDSTGEFDLTINRKHLKVEIFRGPEGELIELLEILSV